MRRPPFLTGLRAAILCAAMAAGSAARAENPSTLTLSLPQVRVAAAQAVRAGRVDLALMLSDTLLRHDPAESLPHYLRAQALMQAGRPSEAARAALRAHLRAATPAQRHESARAAALAEAQQGRFFAAQLWSRRAYMTAPDDGRAARSVAEFRALRGAARLGVDLSLSVGPSDNVNGGAEDALMVVEGLPLVGVLSPSALALSGTLTEAAARLRYRLSPLDAPARTALSALWQRRAVALDEAARRTAPGVDNADFGTELVQFGVTHSRPAGRAHVLAGAFAGRAWAAGRPSHDFSRLQFGAGVPLSAALRAEIGVSRQWQAPPGGAAGGHITTDQWQAGLSMRAGDGLRLGVSVGGGDTEAETAQLRRDVRRIGLSAETLRPLGPVGLRLDLGLEERHYPEYRVLIPVDGGRRDTVIDAALTVRVPGWDVAGFVPALTLRAAQGSSNVSRFDTRTTAVRLGFESAF